MKGTKRKFFEDARELCKEAGIEIDNEQIEKEWRDKDENPKS